MSRAAEKPVDRRMLILDHAERQFAEHGLKGAVLAEIARAAGLGNAGLIHHFPSKAALYRAVLERVAAELDDRLETALAGADDPQARLRGFVEMQVDWALARPLAHRLIQRELLDNRDRVASAHILPLAGFVTRGQAIVEEAQAAGLLAAGPPEVVLSLLIGAIAYAAVVRPTFSQMLGTQLLGSDAGWLAAVSSAVLGNLVSRAWAGT